MATLFCAGLRNKKVHRIPHFQRNATNLIYGVQLIEKSLFHFFIFRLVNVCYEHFYGWKWPFSIIAPYTRARASTPYLTTPYQRFSTNTSHSENRAFILLPFTHLRPDKFRRFRKITIKVIYMQQFGVEGVIIAFYGKNITTTWSIGWLEIDLMLNIACLKIYIAIKV